MGFEYVLSKKLGRWGFFPFFPSFPTLCFLEVKSVKTLRYTLSSAQEVWINTLPSQHCGPPRLQGECQWTVLQSNKLFLPLSLVKIYLKYIIVYWSDFIMSDLFLCSDNWPLCTAVNRFSFRKNTQEEELPASGGSPT